MPTAPVMLSYSDKPTPRVLPFRALLATLAVSVGASYWLVPDQSELVKRLMVDRQYERIADILRAQLGDMANVDTHGLNALSTNQLEALSRLLRLTPREQLQTIFSPTHAVEYDQYAHAVTLAAIRYVDVVKPQQAWEVIGTHAADMKPQQFIEISDVLAKNALALSQPDLAAIILDRVSLVPESTIAQATSMAQAYRWSAQPAQGATKLRSWLGRHLTNISQEEADQANLLSSTLALEGGNASLALDIVLDQLKRLDKDAILADSLIGRAQDYANQSERANEFTPWLARYVNAMPESKLNLRALHELSIREPAQTNKYQQWASTLAKYYDWNSAFDDAFTQHSRIAALGDLYSLDRTLALSEFLGRGEETAELLVSLGSVSERPLLQLRLAGLLANLGDDRQSRTLFESWIAAHPEDSAARFDYASLLMDMGDEDASTAAFAEIVRRQPNHVPATKKLAEGYIRSAKYKEALAAYANLSEADHDVTTLENYALLAESLDQHEQLFKAQALAIHKASKPTVEPYLDLAETTTYLANATPGIELLENGIAQLPNSPALRVATANLWLLSDSTDQAYAILHHDCVKSSFDGTSLILTLGTVVPDQHELLSFVGKDAETRFDFAPGTRLDLGVLSQLCGDHDRCTRLFATVPETAEFRTLLAEARYQTGEYDESIRLLTAHLNGNPKALPTDWIFLGDIYDELGRDADAQKAYDQSLTLLTSDLADTADVSPPASFISASLRSPTSAAP